MAGKHVKQRARVDWDAVRRDYRTSKFTQTELANKHGLDPATLSRKIKKDRETDPESWQQDLTEAVRHATNARVMTEMVKSEIKQGQDQVKDVVKAAAEMGAQVILQHQADLAKARRVAIDLLDELQNTALLAEHRELLVKILAGENPDALDVTMARNTVRRALDIGARISSVKAMADALQKLQDGERRAFKLDDPAPPADDPTTLTDDELDAKINERIAAAAGGAARVPVH